jgi:hypothetical protein
MGWMLLWSREIPDRLVSCCNRLLVLHRSFRHVSHGDRGRNRVSAHPRIHDWQRECQPKVLISANSSRVGY